ncbi:MAG: glycosyltransferase family 39 protein [Chloroflexota bacterium]
MQLFFFSLLHFGALLVLALSSYTLGHRLTRSVSYASAYEQIAFCTALGLGVVAYIVFFIGMLGLLYSPVVLAIFAVLLIACYREWREMGRVLVAAVRNVIRSRKRLAIAALIAVVAAVVLVLYPAWRLPLYPPTSFDATMYHLAAARVYVEHHQVAFDPYLRFPLFPQTNEMLSALMLLLYDDIAAQLVQFLMVLLIAVGLCGWGLRLFSLRVGIWAGALWLSNPLVLAVGSTGLIDGGLALFICMSIYALFNWLTTKNRKWLVLSAIFAGLGSGSKYSALFFVGVLALVALYVAIRERRWTYPVMFVAIAVAVAAPWYLRSFYYTHNPVEPFFSQVFGYHTWNEADMQGQLKDWTLKGMGKDLNALLLLPWNLAQYQGRFGNDLPLLTIYFWLLPLTLLAAFRNRYIRWLLLLVGAFTLFWFYSAQIQRYLLPVVPALILATVAAVDLSLSWLRLPRREPLARLVTAVGLVLCVAPGWLFAGARVEARGHVPVTVAQRDAYLQASLPAYITHRWLSGVCDSGCTLYGLYDEDMAYFTVGDFLGNTFGPARFSDIVGEADTGDDLYRALSRLGAQYFLVTEHRKDVTLPNDASFQRHFKAVFRDAAAGVMVYKLTQ